MMILVTIIIIILFIVLAVFLSNGVTAYAEEQWERKKEDWACIISSKLPESERKEALKTLRGINNRDRELYHSKNRKLE